MGRNRSVEGPCGRVLQMKTKPGIVSPVMAMLLTGIQFRSGECYILISETWWTKIGAVSYTEGIGNVY